MNLKLKKNESIKFGESKSTLKKNTNSSNNIQG